MGHLYQRGPVWWIQFYQDGQRVRMTSESTDRTSRSGCSRSMRRASR
jgi:hypothetical protein